jgi:hypothetical protein
MAFDPEVPCNNLPRLPLSVYVESRAVLRQAARTHKVLGRLNGYCSALPNAALLMDSPVPQ